MIKRWVLTLRWLEHWKANNCWIAILSIVILAYVPFSFAQVHFEQIGNTTLIPDNVVTDIKQDHDGYLWIATAAGVVRYDGYRFKLFEHDPEDESSLGGNFVRDINVFDDGNLWMSTEAGGVSIYHPETENFTHLFNQQTLLDHPGLASVSHVLKGANDVIWLSTNIGVFTATSSGKILKHYTKQEGMPNNGVRALMKDRQGNIWVGTRAGLARYSAQTDRFEAIGTENQNRNPMYIRSLFQANDGRIWVGTDSSGLFVYDAASHQLIRSLNNQPDDYQSSAVFDVFQFSEDELWAARFGGIDRFEAESGKWLSRIIHDPSDSYGLANNDIRTLLRDASGLVWVGGYGGGVQRMLSNPMWQSSFRFSLLRDNALTEPNVSSIIALQDGTIWVGTRGGGINILSLGEGVIGQHKPNIDRSGYLQSGWITALAEFENGDIWVAANPGQLYRFDQQASQFILYGAEQGLPRGNIRALKPSKKGGLWVGTNSGLVYWDNVNDSFVTYQLPQGESYRISVNALHEESDGTLWVATGSAGLFVVHPTEQTLTPIQGTDQDNKPLQSISIVGMLKDTQNRLWLDTPAGLHLVQFETEDTVRLENHSKLAGYGGRPFGANLLEDSVGRLWSPSFIYEPSSQEMTPLQRADGVDIGTSWYRSYTKAPDGKFLFGGSKGLLIIDPAKYTRWRFQPPIVASELSVDGVQVNTGLLSSEGLTLTSEQRAFAIELAALDLSAPEQNRYRYKLSGFEQDWRVVDATRRVASYSNLWPGTYTFTAQGTNRAGLWSDKELTLQVKIKAAYWQTTWFLVLCILLSAFIVYQGIKMRTQRIKARAQKLENEVNERTRELEKVQQDIIEQEKMASLGGLVAGVAHEINTPMGIALTAATALTDDNKTLNQKVETNQLKRSELNKYLEKAISTNKIILGSLERACELMSSFKQVAVDQTSEQRRQFKLMTLLEDIERSLHSLYSKRGHQLEISCAEEIQMDSYPGAIFQVFTNLLNNSIIHGFSERRDGKMTIVAQQKGQQLVFIYQDNGVGMTPDVRKKAFEPFFTTRLGVGGSGLGLHLVYNYVSQVLGGKIKIETPETNGFGCRIEIPLVAPAKEEH